MHVTAWRAAAVQGACHAHARPLPSTRPSLGMLTCGWRAQAPAPEPLTASDGALAPSEGPASAVESAPAPDSVLRLPGQEAAAASAAAAAAAARLSGSGASAPGSAPASPGSGHGQPAWHWVLLALGLVAFVALCAFAVMTLRRRAAQSAAATTTYDNQAFVGPNKAPAGAARETV